MIHSIHRFRCIIDCCCALQRRAHQHFRAHLALVTPFKTNTISADVVANCKLRGEQVLAHCMREDREEGRGCWGRATLRLRTVKHCIAAHDSLAGVISNEAPAAKSNRSVAQYPLFHCPQYEQAGLLPRFSNTGQSVGCGKPQQSR